ncbi:hypothetical protein [Clostridium magnum]|uniref:Uncharacterized protein n=1 Tax=Clostridium magnum DSM 2767 TaxID=1121326 RepID=A0A161XI22_9CLOT|nr:hypothetical protein [Clostridium magnum]KZL94356.1 hypothetical protein CLMAG_14090 [Clostridium magnum DSM 2767]SHJ52251.1 hypothetical protein SAMN02745944_06101 [Clostridium magnum DSM 2767]
MNKEICDYYEPKKRSDKMCKHFTGNINDKRAVARCRHYCSIIDCKNAMGHDSYRRHKGAIKSR